MILTGIQEWQKCQECGEKLPRMASRVFKSNQGLCPRCHLILAEWDLDPNGIEYRDMRLRGKSSIVVPRVELHAPSEAPKQAIPIQA